MRGLIIVAALSAILVSSILADEPGKTDKGDLLRKDAEIQQLRKDLVDARKQVASCDQQWAATRAIVNTIQLRQAEEDLKGQRADLDKQATAAGYVITYPDVGNSLTTPKVEAIKPSAGTIPATDNK